MRQSVRDRMAFKTAPLRDFAFIAGCCCVCDNLGIKSCKTGADVPEKGTK